MAERRIQFRVAVDSAEIRTAKFRGEDYTVIPLVAMKPNMVWHPVNSSYKGDFVSAEVIAASAPLWANRPGVMNHPQDGANFISANDPATLEKYAFGFIFNPTYDAKVGLKLEAYVSRVLAENLEDDALRTQALDVLDRAAKGELIEVSGGMTVIGEEIDGVFEGEAYSYEYFVIFPDHLAFLPKGTAGACSVESGCGGPRIATRLIAALKGLNSNSSEGKGANVKLGAIARKLKLEYRQAQRNAEDKENEATYRTAELNGELSDKDQRDILNNALYANVPAYDWYIESYADQGICRYQTYIPGEGEQTWEIDFTIDEATKVATLIGEPRKIEWTVSYQVVASGNENPKETKMATPEVVAAATKVIGCDCTPYTEDNRAALEVLTVAQIEDIGETFKNNPVVVKPPEVPVTATPVTATLEDSGDDSVGFTAEEKAALLSTVSSMAPIVAKHAAAEAQQHQHYAKLLTAHDAANFTPEFLTSKSVNDLKVIAAVLKINQPVGVVNAGVADFSIVPAATPGGEGIPPRKLVSGIAPLLEKARPAKVVAEG